MSQPQLWDISPAVHAKSPVFPGDTPYSQAWSWVLDGQCPVNVCAMTLSPHVGAHADAPLHYDPHGQPIGAVDLWPYLGPCLVVHAMHAQGVVHWTDVARALDTAQLPPRVLFRTRHRAATTTWDPDLIGLHPELIDTLADRGVMLVGVDSASVDPASSKALQAHQVLRRRQLRVLENLVLDDVPEGHYELIALPLKLRDADASPVRAVLRSWN